MRTIANTISHILCILPVLQCVCFMYRYTVCLEALSGLWYNVLLLVEETYNSSCMAPDS